MTLTDDVFDQLMQRGMRDFAEILGRERASATIDRTPVLQRHPLQRLLTAVLHPDHDDYAFRALHATAMGTRRARIAGWHDWLSACLDAAAGSDHERADGALAELRAAGALLSTEIKVAPRPTKGTPSADLMVSAGGEEGVVEVTSKRLNGEEARSLEAHLSEPFEPSPTGVSIKQHDVFPAGRPRGEECIAENVAQKLAQKKDDAQAIEGQPSILWVDLQSEWWSCTADSVRPLTRRKGVLYTFGIWHGFYGRKGLPLFEEHVERLGGPLGIWRQRFDGLLRQRPKWSAAVVSLPSTIVVFENPWAQTPIGSKIRQSLLLVPNADISASWGNWGTVPLRQLVEAEWERLEYVARRDEEYLERQFEKR